MRAGAPTRSACPSWTGSHPGGHRAVPSPGRLECMKHRRGQDRGLRCRRLPRSAGPVAPDRLRLRRGVQPRLTHAVVFDEAHRAARLKLIPQFGKECRKSGLALALASQEARDFDPSLFAAVGSNLVLRVTEADARTLARMTGSTLEERRTADRLKALERYTALFFAEGRPRPISVHLAN
jgi:hypothetical protein